MSKETTSRSVASKAGRLLRNKETDPEVRSVAGSALTQRESRSPSKELFPAEDGDIIRYVGKETVLDKETGAITSVIREDHRIPTWRRNGERVLHLPEGSVQKRGFRHRDAGLLLRAYPGDFKRLETKGGGEK